MKLAGQIAVVVGGARGIGEAIAHLFSKEGANVVLVDVAKAKSQLDGVAQAINQRDGNAIAVIADATDDAQVDNMVNRSYRAPWQNRRARQQRGIARAASPGARHHRGGMGSCSFS